MESNKTPALNLATLPSELRKIIVSHLAPPSIDDLEPGCKAHLKNANAAHSCLREWVPEYMFRDMALDHVIVDMTSHLERFAIQIETDSLLKHVKAIEVKVPPAIRWEVDAQDDLESLEDNTTRRLYNHFQVTKASEMNDSQRQFAADYHRAMVQPFVENRRWYSLLRNAEATWGRIFRCFPNLQEIVVGQCPLIDYPKTTSTYSFMLRHGKYIQTELEPPYREDFTVNVAWASAVVLKTAPPNVRHLHLGMANLDNFNSLATVNSLQNYVYRKIDFLVNNLPSGITKLTVALGGVDGVHGDPDHRRDTGSAGMLRYWAKVLPSLTNLTYLQIYFVSMDWDISFTNEESTDRTDNVLYRLLRNYKPEKLQTLKLRVMELEKDRMRDMFHSHWPSLKTVIFDEIGLLKLSENDTAKIDPEEQDIIKMRHLQGGGWIDLCQFLKNKYPGLQIRIHRPSSDVRLDHGYCYDYDEREKLSPKYIEELRGMPGVSVTGLPDE